MEETNETTTPAPTNGATNANATPAWFEFILDETLLERHLNDPTAGELACCVCLAQ